MDDLTYRFDVSCPRCGRPLTHRAGGASNGFETRAVAACARCCDEWVIEVRITSNRTVNATGRLPARRPPRPELCGTRPGPQWHRDRDEPLCTACLAVEADRKCRSRELVAT